MKKILIILISSLFLFSCWINTKSDKEKQNNIIEYNNKVDYLDNYILFWTHDEIIPDLEYSKQNIEKIKKILHRNDLSWINLENIKSNKDLKDIILLIKDNVNKNIELSITLKYSQLNDDILSILMDFDVKKLWIMIWVNKKINVYRISKNLWDKIINRKVKKLWITDAMENLFLEFDDKNQLEKLKKDFNFKLNY